MGRCMFIRIMSKLSKANALFLSKNKTLSIVIQNPERQRYGGDKRNMFQSRNQIS